MDSIFKQSSYSNSCVYNQNQYANYMLDQIFSCDIMNGMKGEDTIDDGNQSQEKVHQSFLNPKSLDDSELVKPLYDEFHSFYGNRQQKQIIVQSDSFNRDFYEVFLQKQIRVERNINFIKYFLRKLAQKYYTYGVEIFKEYPIIFKEMNCFMKRQKQSYRDERNWNINLNSMNKFFGIDHNKPHTQLRSFLTRKMAHYILRTIMIPQLIEQRGNKIHRKTLKSYIFSIKITLLRCRNAQLMQRVRTH